MSLVYITTPTTACSSTYSQGSSGMGKWIVGCSPGKRLGVRGGEGRDGLCVFFNNGPTGFITCSVSLILLSVRKIVGNSNSTSLWHKPLLVEVSWYSHWSSTVTFCPVGLSCSCCFGLVWSCLVCFGLKILKSGSVEALLLSPSSAPLSSVPDSKFNESCLSCWLAFTSSVYVMGSIPIA